MGTPRDSFCFPGAQSPSGADMGRAGQYRGWGHGVSPHCLGRVLEEGCRGWSMGHMGGAPRDRQGTRPAGGQGLQEASRGGQPVTSERGGGSRLCWGEAARRGKWGLGLCSEFGEEPWKQGGPLTGHHRRPWELRAGPLPCRARPGQALRSLRVHSSGLVRGGEGHEGASQGLPALTFWRR